MQEQTDRIFAAWSYLIKPIARRLRENLPAGILLEDLEQMGALGLLDAAAHYDEARAATFGAYARQRIRGAMIDGIRGPEYRAATHASLDADEAPERRDPAPGPEEVAADRERDRALDGALEVLTPRQRALVLLRRQGLTQRQAAARLGGISQQGVAELERRALRRIRRKLAA